MALIAMLSPGGSPGVTTTALSLALAWPRRVVLAECDPSGGAVAAGLWGGRVPAGRRGLQYFALEAQCRPRQAPDALAEYVIPLAEDHDERVVLPGVADPLRSRRLASAWPALTEALTALDSDVIADAGRFDGDTALDPLLAKALMIIMVLRPTIRQITAARPRLAALRQLPGGCPTVGIGVIGRGAYGGGASGHHAFGHDGSRAICAALNAPVLFEIPDDPAAAAVLSDGATGCSEFGSSALMLAAGTAAACLDARAGGRSRPNAARLAATGGNGR